MNDDYYIDRVFVVEISTLPDVEIGESDVAKAIYQGVEGINSEDAIDVTRQPSP